MTIISTRMTVGPDRAISIATKLQAGDYVASIEMCNDPGRQAATQAFDVDGLPVHDFGPWPEGISLRRDDLYGDDGR